jgi:hypothetical protein
MAVKRLFSLSRFKDTVLLLKMCKICIKISLDGKMNNNLLHISKILWRVSKNEENDEKFNKEEMLQGM